MPLFSIVFPLFALIFLGYWFRKKQRFGAHACTEINTFVVWLALPALLFSVITRSNLNELWHPGFIFVFSCCSFFIFISSLIIFKKNKPTPDACLDALNASYSNTGFMGIPLCALVFGYEKIAPAVVATLITVCALFLLAMLILEFTTSSPCRRSYAAIGRALMRNPLFIAPISAFIIKGVGWQLPLALLTLIDLLAAVASPAALITIGIFIAEHKPTFQKESAWLIAIKLIATPLLAWFLAVPILKLPPLLAQSAILLSALPTGTGPYLLAHSYHRSALNTSQTILWSTLISIASLSVILWLMAL